MNLLTNIVLLASAVVLLNGLRGRQTLGKYFELVHTRSILQETLDRLTEEDQSIVQEIEKIKKSPQYARKVLRDKFHVIEDDEAIVFFGE